MNVKSRPPERIGAVLESFLAERGYLAVCKECEIQEQWPRIVGEKIAAVTTCMRIEDGVVYVRVNSAPWRQELVYMKNALLDNINKQCTTIRDIVFC